MRRKIWRTHDLAKLIGPKRKLARGRDLCIFLAQTARTCVAWVRRHVFRLLAFAYSLFVFTHLGVTKFFKRRERHINLATHLKHARHNNTRTCDQFFRYNGNRANICRDIFADLAVTTRRRLHQFTVLIANAQCQPVDLKFACKLHRDVVETFGRALAPCLQLSDIHCIVETCHRHAMRHGVKSRRTSTNNLCRRCII